MSNTGGKRSEARDGKIRQSEDELERKAQPGIKAEETGLDFAQIMNAVGQGVLVTGRGWRFEYVNPAFARILGRALADVIGRSMDDFIIPEDEAILALQRSRRLKGETTSYDFRLRKPDGEIVYVRATGVPRRLEGKIIGSISIITDITDQKRIEKALEAERDRAEKYLNIAEVILVALDTEARISMLNRKGYQILGYGEANS